MLFNLDGPINLINFDNITIHSFDICKKKFGKPEKISDKLVPRVESYINSYAYRVVIKKDFYDKVKAIIMNSIYKEENGIFILNSSNIEKNIIEKLLVNEIKSEYKKVLSTVIFIKKAYYENVSSFLTLDGNINEFYEFNLFLILVYEFYKNRHNDMNSAIIKAFAIMDMLFYGSWNYVFMKLSEREYLEFLEKNIYSNIIGKNVFFIEFNFKAVKIRYMEYLVKKVKAEIIKSV